MKAKPLQLTDTGYEVCKPDSATHVRINMPGPLPDRVLPVILKGRRDGTNCWSWNGDTEKPTLKPSIKSWVHGVVCHSWVNDGIVEFLNDSTHEYAGQSHELLDVE